MPLPLTDPFFCVDVGAFPGQDVTDQSGLLYDPIRRQLIIFGGGHAAAWEDAPLRMPIDTLTWEWCYTPMPLETMNVLDGEGKLANLMYPQKFWKRAEAGLGAPARSPVSRHSYTGWLWSHAINKALMLGYNNAKPYPLPQDVVGGYAGEFEPATNEWSIIPMQMDWRHMYVEDPVSQRIITLWSNGVRTYDPATQVLSAAKGGSMPFVQYGLILRYYPPNDKFYFFRFNPSDTPNGPATYEITIDRTTWTPTWTLLETNYHPQPRWQGTGLEYDSTNELLVGWMQGGYMYGFRPTTAGKGEWLWHPIPTLSTPAAYTQAYVEEINTHFIITGNGVGDRTWAFRWDPRLARIAGTNLPPDDPPPVDPPPPPPPPDPEDPPPPPPPPPPPDPQGPTGLILKLSTRNTIPQVPQTLESYVDDLSRAVTEMQREVTAKINEVIDKVNDHETRITDLEP
jgi:hypothetical protein